VINGGAAAVRTAPCWVPFWDHTLRTLVNDLRVCERLARPTQAHTLAVACGNLLPLLTGGQVVAGSNSVSPTIVMSRDIAKRPHLSGAETVRGDADRRQQYSPEMVDASPGRVRSSRRPRALCLESRMPVMHTATMGTAATTVHAADSPTTVGTPGCPAISLCCAFELRCGTERFTRARTSRIA
jgi:hypothetical protein